MATITVPTTAIRATQTRSGRRLVIGWVLMLPFMFYAVNGTFSFEDTSNNVASANSLSGLAANTRHLGFVGYVIIPGIAYSIVLWLLLTNASRIISLAMQMKMLTLLALLTIVSAAWSQSPLGSAYNGVFYLIETLFAFYLVLRFDTEQLRGIFTRAGVVLSVLGLLMVVFFPRFAVVQGARDLGGWQGVFGDRTSAAKSLVFLLSPAIIFRRRSFGYGQAAYILLMAFMIVMAHAMTARVILPFYILFMALIRIYSRFGRRSALLISGTFLLATALIVYAGLPFLPVLLQDLGRNATLSGRTGIWALVLRSIAKRPLLGYGFHAFWLGLTGESANIIISANWIFGYAHNGILEIWLQLGLVGVAVFFVTLFQAIGNAWYCLRKGCPPGVEWYIGLIALTIMYNIDESTVVWPIQLLSILYIVACCGLALAVQRIKSMHTTGGFV